ncbi:MAG: transposase [Bacteroidota bacterium]|nr:transposase [Bacteroidota bacterium]
MHFTPNEIYHVYNRGNNKQLIFFNKDNYIFFLKKIRNEWKKYCDILCYCLMPNHFHCMIVPNDEACKNIELGNKLTHMQNFSRAIGKTLSSYTKAINIQNHTTGNLFQKKTKAKCITNIEVSGDSKSPDTYLQQYLQTCFHYIHQNPLQARLITNLKDWQYSSFQDYYGYRKGTLCNKKMAMELLSFTENDFKNEEVVSLDEKIISQIF